MTAGVVPGASDYATARQAVREASAAALVALIQVTDDLARGEIALSWSAARSLAELVDDLVTALEWAGRSVGAIRDA